MIIDADGQAFPKFPKYKVCNVFTISCKKGYRDENDFLPVDKFQNFLQVDFSALIINVSLMVILSLMIAMMKHSEITQSNKLAISLQYLEKGVMEGVQFLHADKHLSFYKLSLSFLVEVTRHVQSTQNKKLVMFLQYLKKSINSLILSVENKNLCIQKVTGHKFY